MEAVGCCLGERAMRASAFRVRYAQRRAFYSSRVNLAAFLFFRRRSIRDSVVASRRVVSGWSAIRNLRPSSRNSASPVLRHQTQLVSRRRLDGVRSHSAYGAYL